MESIISPDIVKQYKKPTEKFLVKLENNAYNIRFIGMKIRDIDTGDVYQDFKAENIYQLDYFADNILEYYFPNQILKAKSIGTNSTFIVGDNLVRNMKIIERHFINDNLVGNYEFDFPICMPGSTNNIEFIYNIPKLEESVQRDLIDDLDIYAESDTFIFVENKLVIHRRAKYTYTADI
jgi:hypothetical protein